MKFKENNAAAMLRQDGVDLAGLMRALEKGGIMDDIRACEEDFCGVALGDALDEICKRDAAEHLISEFMGVEPDILQRAYLDNLVLMGDGACPECGCSKIDSEEFGQFDESYDGCHAWNFEHWEHRCKCCGYEWNTYEEMLDF